MDYIDRNLSIVTQGSFNNFVDCYKKFPKTTEEKEEIKSLTKMKLDAMKELEEELKKEPITYEKVDTSSFRNTIIKDRVVANGKLTETKHELSEPPF